MAKVAMILRRAPYGDINAAEAVRHALGGVADGLGVQLILADGGVLVAKKGQEAAGTGFTNLEQVLRDCIDMGVEVFADRLSLKDQHIDPSDILEGVNVLTGAEIAAIIEDAKTTMIF